MHLYVVLASFLKVFFSYLGLWLITGLVNYHRGTCPACTVGLDLIGTHVSEMVACSVGCRISSSSIIELYSI